MTPTKGWLKRLCNWLLPAPQGNSSWVQDCLIWHGQVLKGKFSHWCVEWDDLPIDETCAELSACLCYDLKDPEFQKARDAASALREQAPWTEGDFE